MKAATSGRGAPASLRPIDRRVHDTGSPAGSAAIPIDYSPSRVELFAERCANMAHFAETGCAQKGEEPLWKACLGVLAFAENGDKVAHKWSAKDGRYGQGETQKKIDERK